MKTLEEEWQEFRKTIPEGAGETQLEQMELAFYAGVTVAITQVKSIHEHECKLETLLERRLYELFYMCQDKMREYVSKFARRN